MASSPAGFDQQFAGCDIHPALAGAPIECLSVSLYRPFRVARGTARISQLDVRLGSGWMIAAIAAPNFVMSAAGIAELRAAAIARYSRYSAVSSKLRRIEWPDGSRLPVVTLRERREIVLSRGACE